MNPIKLKAIKRLRDMIEGEGASVDAAMAAITARYALGLNDLADIRAKATAKYAVAS